MAVLAEGPGAGGAGLGGLRLIVVAGVGGGVHDQAQEADADDHQPGDLEEAHALS